jgi:hypothetical protein
MVNLSAISHQPSAISHQPLTMTIDQPLAFSDSL